MRLVKIWQILRLFFQTFLVLYCIFNYRFYWQSLTTTSATKWSINMSKNCEGHACSIESSSSVRQTLDEMDFERGIWYAAQQNDSNRVENLLRKGIPVNKEDLAGYTALHYASRNGHVLCCKILLDNGANVNAQTRSGQATALHRAASQGHIKVVELLLKAKADPNIKDADGLTALHRAIKAEAVTVCQILIPMTDILIGDNQGRSCLQLAVEKGNKEIVDLIEEN